MEANELKYVLEELRFSAALPGEVIEHIAVHASLRTISPGEMVFREGQENDNLFLVRHGRIALEMSVPGRGPVRILTLGPGEMLGWSALIGEGKMTTSAVVTGEEAEVIVVPAARLTRECESNPRLGYHLMQRMAEALSRRLVATRLQLLDLFAQSPDELPSATVQGQSP